MADAHSPSGTRWIWNVFWLLLAVTGQLAGTSILNLIFIGLTLVKAGYIVQYFMHLKYEDSTLRSSIYLPVLILIPYLTFITLYEGVKVFGY